MSKVIPNHAKREKNLERYLKKAGALSEPGAITISDEQWKEFGWISNPYKSDVAKSLSQGAQSTFLGSQTVARMTKNNKFWFSEEHYIKRRKFARITCFVLAVGLPTGIIGGFYLLAWLIARYT